MGKILLSGLIAAGVLLFSGASFAQSNCDTDYNGDGQTDMVDVEILKSALGSQPGDENFLAQADHNGDGMVSIVDYGILLSCN